MLVKDCWNGFQKIWGRCDSDSLKHKVSSESRNDQTINKASWSFETPWTKDQGYKSSIYCS